MSEQGEPPLKDRGTCTAPLSEANLEIHVEERIEERMALSHLWRIEDGEVVPTERAGASLWRVVKDAVAESGWRIVR